MKRTISVFALMLALSAIAFAHGNEKHVMGTVGSISDNSITVETTSKDDYGDFERRDKIPKKWITRSPERSKSRR